jgi:hypothetical protein
MDYYSKYLKYKQKYLDLKQKMDGGVKCSSVNETKNIDSYSFANKDDKALKNMCESKLKVFKYNNKQAEKTPVTVPGMCATVKSTVECYDKNKPKDSYMKFKALYTPGVVNREQDKNLAVDPALVCATCDGKYHGKNNTATSAWFATNVNKK